jgi:hypothetical protein
MSQIHIADRGLIQTLAAVESPDGLTLLSTFGHADGLRDIVLHIPTAARAWLAGVAGAAKETGRAEAIRPVFRAALPGTPYRGSYRGMA